MSVYDAKALYLLRFTVIWEATTEFTNIYTVRNGFPLIPYYLGRRTNTWEQPCTYVNINSVDETAKSGSLCHALGSVHPHGHTDFPTQCCNN